MFTIMLIKLFLRFFCVLKLSRKILWKSLDRELDKTPNASTIKDPTYRMNRVVYLTMVSAIQIIGGCRVFSSKCINLKVSTRNMYHEANVIIIINRYFWQWFQTCLTQGLMFWLSLSTRASPSEMFRAWPTCRSEKPSIFAFWSRSLGTVALRVENGLRNSSRNTVCADPKN